MLPIAYALSSGLVFWLASQICGVIVPAANVWYSPPFCMIEIVPTQFLATAFFWTYPCGANSFPEDEAYNMVVHKPGLWCVGICCVGLMFCGSSTCESNDEKLLSTVVENVLANESLFANMEVITKREFKSLLPESRRHADTVLNRTVDTRCVFQNGKFYLNRIDATQTSSDFANIRSEVGFDGIVTRAVEGNVANIRNQRLEPSGLIKPHTILLEHNAWIGDARLSEYLSQKRSPRKTNYHTTVDGNEIINGLNTVRLRIETWRDKQKDHDFRYLWLAVDRNYLPVKTAGYGVGYSKTIPLDEGSVEEFVEVQAGVWFPKKISDHVNSEKDASKGVVTQISANAINTAKIDLHPRYDATLFSNVDIPKGAVVYDVAADGKLRQTRVEGEPPLGSIAQSPTKTWIIWINVVAVSVVVLAIVWRNRWRPHAKDPDKAA